MVLDHRLKAFSVQIGKPMSDARLRCIRHNSELVDLSVIGYEYDEDVKACGVIIDNEQKYSEVLRLILLSREPNLLYLDTDCLLIEPPDFGPPGVGRKSNWAMFSGDNPGIFKSMLEDVKARKKVHAGMDWGALCKAGAKTINAIHKWEIPWFKE